jgi:hypothetical protein
MGNDKKSLNVGADAVVMGNVSGSVGNGSVVIGAMDERGNVILNQPMAVGRNAYAGPGSIAIGANASAGSDLSAVLGELRKIVEAGSDQNVRLSFDKLTLELSKPQKDVTTIAGLWDVVKTFAAANGALGLAERASYLLRLTAQLTP